MNWGKYIDEYGWHVYTPDIPNIDDKDGHASGSIVDEREGKETCNVCQTTGKCVRFSDHRDVCTDEIDLSLCSRCLEKGVDILLGKKEPLIKKAQDIVNNMLEMQKEAFRIRDKVKEDANRKLPWWKFW